MPKTINIINEAHCYKGFNQFSVYDFKVPSLNPEKEFIEMNKREVLHCPDSVIVLIYSPSSDSLLFCQQFRAGVYLNKADDTPYPLECVAGSVDSNKTPEDIAREEVREEAGLEADGLELVCKAYASPGITTEKTHIFFARINDLPQRQLGGIPESGEEILTHVIKRVKVFQMMDNMEFNDVKTLLALNWFRCKAGLIS